jgi:hypothetical protein
VKRRRDLGRSLQLATAFDRDGDLSAEEAREKLLTREIDAAFMLTSWDSSVVRQLRAPSVKEDSYTILSERDAWPEFARMIAHDPALIGCFA